MRVAIRTRTPAVPPKIVAVEGTQGRFSSTDPTLTWPDSFCKSETYCTDPQLKCIQGKMLYGGGGEIRTHERLPVAGFQVGFPYS